MTTFALILTLAGVLFIFANKKVAQTTFKLQKQTLKMMFGNRIDLESRYTQTFYRSVVVILGIFFLIAAYAFYFGPIYL